MANYQEQDNNQSDYSNSEEKSEADKKKSRILITIEIILFLLVLILAIIFFSNRSEGGFSFSNIFNSSNNENNQTVNEGPNSGDLQLNDDINSNQGSSGSDLGGVNSPSVSTPQGGNTQRVESPRLSLPVPDQSPVASEEDIPENAIQIDGVESGFSPNQFTVSSGEEVTLALTSKIDYPVILTFYDPNMPAISIGLNEIGESRWITFTAPSEPGEYIFRNDVFGKSEQTGVMIVE